MYITYLTSFRVRELSTILQMLRKNSISRYYRPFEDVARKIASLVELAVFICMNGWNLPALKQSGKVTYIFSTYYEGTATVTSYKSYVGQLLTPVQILSMAVSKLNDPSSGPPITLKFPMAANENPPVLVCAKKARVPCNAPLCPR